MPTTQRIGSHVQGERTLYLQFRLAESDDLSPSDFVSFFEFGAAVTQQVALDEWRMLVESLKLNAKFSYTDLSEAESQMRLQPAPAQVLEVEHNSPWHYLLAIPGSLLTYFFMSCVRPEIKRAWEGSQAREALFDFLRERLFFGSVEKLSRGKKPTSKRNSPLKIKAVTAQDKKGEDLPTILIVLERRTIQPVTITDEDFLEDIRRRISKGKR